jgi:drug/metabolite transporter (DMT)-like permease
VNGARRLATLCGVGALLLWSTLAVLATTTGPIPPFQLTAVTFAAGGALGLAVHGARGGRAGLRRALIQPPRAWAVGVGGLFGYHVLYFAALRRAPAAEAGLFNYLWPLLLVLGAALAPGERLRLGHVLGALLGFSGVGLLLGGPERYTLDATRLTGDALALAGAFVWAAYSLASRRFGDVPTESVSAFSLATGLLALGVHLAFEAPVLAGGRGSVGGADRAGAGAGGRVVPAVGPRHEGRRPALAGGAGVRDTRSVDAAARGRRADGAERTSARGVRADRLRSGGRRTGRAARAIPSVFRVEHPRVAGQAPVAPLLAGAVGELDAVVVGRAQELRAGLRPSRPRRRCRRVRRGSPAPGSPWTPRRRARRATRRGAGREWPRRIVVRRW